MPESHSSPMSIDSLHNDLFLAIKYHWGIVYLLRLFLFVENPGDTEYTSLNEHYYYSIK